MDKSHQGSDTPEGTAAHGGIHAGAEEMSKKEGAMKEKSKKQGVAKKKTLYRPQPPGLPISPLKGLSVTCS